MYSQEFDASEFDYLNAGDFAQTESQTTAKTPKITNIERFWTLTGNWGEFGLYFGIGLSASLVVRAIPALIPAAVIFIPSISLGVALLSANWDAWLAWVIANSQLLIFSAAITVITLGFVGVQIWSKLSNAGK